MASSLGRSPGWGGLGRNSYSYYHTHHRRETGVNLTWYSDGWESGTSPSVRLSALRGGGKQGMDGALAWLREENKVWAHKASKGYKPNGRSYVSLLIAPDGLSGWLLLLRSSGG